MSTEKGYIRTYVARFEGRKFIVVFPGPIEYITDMRSEQASSDAVKWVKENGVDCNLTALNRLLNNF